MREKDIKYEVIFYDELATSIQTYQMKFRKDPDIFNDVVEFTKDKYGDYDNFLWQKYFSNNIRITKNCKENTLIVYYVGPDKLDNQIQKRLILPSETKFRNYKNQEGDVILGEFELFDPCN